MFRRNLSIVLIAATSSVFLSGCMPEMTIEQMKADMPKRPAELDALNVLVGDWTFSGEARMTGIEEPLKSTGTNTGKWAGDGWYFINDHVFHMDELGGMKGHEVWTYDIKAKCFRTSWVDSMGYTGFGIAHYCDKSKTFTMTAGSYTPWGKTSMKGTIKVVDNNTVEWWMKESVMWGLFTTMEMEGTSRRK